ncbi:SH3 domain-containing protein [uncultured Brevundimonas sp.]|uniref:SH3 domain-containing protein n=1 Tax=uncultured Brevundimonas sp. TaxID=213418 RepID=UPI00261C7838|nr:SH3 domain-containing protein [uncultured Brevundimonas sp.]
MSSKALPRFQRLAVAAAAVCAAGLAGAAQTMPDGRPTPSGQPVPRWLSLKSSEVHARFGPGLDHRILWAYRVSGLPVQVIAETTEWRKICDPEGAVAWVHRSVVSSRRSLFNATREEIPVRSGRSPGAPVRARLSPRSLAAMDDCEGGWCRIRAGRLRGWVRETAVFGTQAGAMCDAARPAGPRPGPADGGG